jgi:hypothetical protein
VGLTLDDGFQDDLVDLVKTVSASLSTEAEELLREDPDSLLRYIGSSAFLDDLLGLEVSIELGTDAFFFVLLHQLKRKFREDEPFRREFQDSLSSSSDHAWDDASIRRYLNDQQVIIYLVNMLDDFVKTERVHSPPSVDDEEFHYVFEMIEASQSSSESERYRIFCHIGNYSLYLTGMFPDWIRYRHEHKNRPMDIEDYSDYGKTYFNKASKHRLARERHMEPVLKKLSKGYHLVRTSLEFLFKRIVPAFK